MNVVLFTTGMGAPKAAKNAIREKAPKLVRSIKDTGLLLPACIQRPLLSGFTRERRFPSGLGYLSAMLKQRGHRVSLVDRFIEQQAWIDGLASVDFVGVHTITPCFEDALAVVSRLEQEGYTGPIAFGGPHVALYPETVPPRVDYVVQGEAEYLIADLVEGVYAPSTIIQTPRIKDLDALPRADYELFLDRPRPYELSMPFVGDKPIYHLTTSRSCPYRCTFCAVRSVWGRLWKAHSAERIVDDILYLKKPTILLESISVKICLLHRKNAFLKFVTSYGSTLLIYLGRARLVLRKPPTRIWLRKWQEAAAAAFILVPKAEASECLIYTIRKPQ